MQRHLLRRFGKLFGPAAVSLALVSGCQEAKKAETAALPSHLSGYVRDGAGAAVAQAVVANESGSQTTLTDAAGHYTMPVAAADLEDGALSAVASRFSTTYRQVASDASTQDFVLRPFDADVAVTLPTDGQPAATASATRGDGTVTVNIPAASLVTSAGAAAAGAANVRLTYWNPLTDTNNVPTPLVARLPKGTDGNGPYDLPLQTLGMVDIQIMQGNDVLQVAPGKTITLDHLVPPAIAKGMAQRPNDMPDPYMFYFDTTKNRWILDGNLTWNANAGMMSGELPHLTTWNFDYFQNWMPPASCTSTQIALAQTPECSKPQNSSVGGCISGMAVANNGDAYANKTVRLYLFDNEHVSAIDLATDANGQYCANVGTKLCIPVGDTQVNCSYTTNTISYLVSGTDSPDTSSMADPIPTQCRSGADQNYPAMNYVSSCGLVADTDKNLPATVTPLSTPASAIISAGTYCSSVNSCAAIPDVTISSSVAKSLASTTPAKTCKLPRLPAGSPCTATVMADGTCCDVGLTCRDYVCVPPESSQN